eukprot:maker-scaffold_15-snap-gene-5.59-mRNA-1 protein AED:0.00 eAED:0.00 QI:130/1/1/1/1/1/3/61/274
MSTLEKHIKSVHEIQHENIKPIQPLATEEITRLREAMESEEHLTDKVVMAFGGENRAYQRFLRARGNDVTKAKILFSSALEMRKELGIDNPLDEKVVLLFKQMDEFWPFKFWGYSKTGNLLIQCKLENIRPKEFVKKYSEEEIRQYFLNYSENSFKLQNFGNSRIKAEEDKEWKGTIEIYDFKNLGRNQIDVKGLSILKNVLRLGQTMSPENLQKSYLINVPWFFKNFMWPVIKKCMNEYTVHKVFVDDGYLGARQDLEKHFGDSDLLEQFLGQ